MTYLVVGLTTIGGLLLLAAGLHLLWRTRATTASRTSRQQRLFIGTAVVIIVYSLAMLIGAAWLLFVVVK